MQQEVTRTTINGITWLRPCSSESNCVEVAFLADGMVAVRSSNRPETVVRFTMAEWEAFRAAVGGPAYDYS